MLPAVKAVFDTTEILESILHKLPARDGGEGMKTLLVSQRVCRRWKLVIETSAKIQRALFFEPVNVEALTSKQQFEQGHAWESTWAWLTETGQHHPVYRNQLLGPLFTAMCDRYACLPTWWERREASWRRMMLTQPGVILRCTIRPAAERDFASDCDFNTKTEYAGEIYNSVISVTQYYASSARFGARGIAWTGPDCAVQIERMHLGW